MKDNKAIRLYLQGLTEVQEIPMGAIAIYSAAVVEVGTREISPTLNLGPICK